MSIRIHVSAELADAARDHLSRRGERVGFFLADATSGLFTLHQWRPIDEDALVPAWRAILTDNTAAEVVRWAFASGAALVEVHSHGLFAPAQFSPIDIEGFTEWVRGVRWRLRGAPYAAAVVAADTIDAWAWINSNDRPEQIDTVVVGGTTIIPTTRATLESLDAEHGR